MSHPIQLHHIPQLSPISTTMTGSTTTNPDKPLPGHDHPELNGNGHRRSRPADLEAAVDGIKPAYECIQPYPAAAEAQLAPLGLIGFACSIFLLSVFDLEPRGIKHPDVMVGNLVFFGGLAQFVAGIGEFMLGHSVSANIEPSRVPLRVLHVRGMFERNAPGNC